MGVAECSFVAGVVIGCAASWLAARLSPRWPSNEHAWMLGRRARARKYQCYGWEDGTIVCVTLKGGVRFRSDDGSGFWIDKERTGMNLVVCGHPARRSQLGGR